MNIDQEERRPLILEIDEAKAEIIQCINNAIQGHGLPCYIIELLLSDVMAQIKEGAKTELSMAKAQIQSEEKPT